MMHLEIIQGGGISSGFPPAIASILPTIALDSFWAEYYDNSFNPSNWRLKRSLLSLNSNRSQGLFIPIAANLYQRYTDSNSIPLGIFPVYLVDTSDANYLYIKIATDIPESEITYVQVYIAINPYILYSTLGSNNNPDFIYDVYGFPVYAYDKVTFENVPLTLMDISFIDSGSRNRIIYSSKVRCQHPDPSNVVVAASREFLYEST